MVLPYGPFEQTLVKIGEEVLEKELKMWKDGSDQEIIIILFMTFE